MIENNKKIVIDTNVLISAILFPNSLIAQSAYKAMAYWDIYASQSTVNEFLEVISRSKFDKYFLNRPNGREIFTENFVKAITIEDLLIFPYYSCIIKMLSISIFIF